MNKKILSLVLCNAVASMVMGGDNHLVTLARSYENTVKLIGISCEYMERPNINVDINRPDRIDVLQNLLKTSFPPRAAAELDDLLDCFLRSSDGSCITLYVFNKQVADSLAQTLSTFKNENPLVLQNKKIKIVYDLPHDELAKSQQKSYFSSKFVGFLCSSLEPIVYDIIYKKKFDQGIPQEYANFITERLDRGAVGDFSGSKSLGNGVFEYKFGTQLRFYCIVFDQIKIGEELVNEKFLCALSADDNKVDQYSDIQRAKKLSQDALVAVKAEVVKRRKERAAEEAKYFQKNRKK